MKRIGAAAVLLAAAHVAHGEWKSLTGEEAPDVTVSQWFNQAEGNSLADFRGKAVLLEYWATWWGPCKTQVPHLNELRESFEKKGLRILAITNEEASKVQPFILEHGITYPVGISSDSSGYGSGGIPHAYLIGPDGTVLWEGHPASLSDGDIEKATRKTKDFYVRKVCSELKPAASAFEKGKLSEAKALAEAAKEKGGEGDVGADADYVLSRVAQFLTFWNRTIEKSTEEGRYDDVLDALGRIQKHYPGTEEATAAATKEKELKADAAVKAEIDAWKKLEKLIEDATEAKGDERKLKSVQKKLEKFLESYGTSKAAKRAQQVLDAIRK